jgi:hypothetical protein
MSDHLARRAIGAGVLAAGLLIGGAALAGDSNQVSVLQSGSGNSLFTDQSQVSNSLLGIGPNPFNGNSNPLTQAGTGNTASIIVSPGTSSSTSDAAGSAFLQQGSAGGLGVGNSATIHIIGAGSVGSVTQDGNNNTANLTAQDGAHGAIAQSGSSNFAGLTVVGSGVNVLYQQQGSNLSTGPIGGPGITITSSTIMPGLPSDATSSGTLPVITITQH